MLPDKIKQRNQFTNVEDIPIVSIAEVPKPKARLHLLNSDFKDHITIEQIKSLASMSLTASQVADFYGFNRNSFRKFLNKNPEYNLAYQQGKLEVDAKVSKVVIEAALNGDIRAATFYLQSQGGWSTKQSVEHSAKDVSQDDINREKEALMGKLFKLSQQDLIQEGIIEADFVEVVKKDDEHE